MNWGKAQVHIPYGAEGGTAYFMRIPCFLSTMPDPNGSGNSIMVLRERIHGRPVHVMCDPQAVGFYSNFIGTALESARNDESLLYPDGNMYAMVLGIMVEDTKEHVVVRTDVPGGGFGLDWVDNEPYEEE